MAKQESHDMLYEMASVGYFTTFNKNGKQESQKFKVFVCSDEGEIPHMHIWDDETDGKKIHTCVCLDKIEYFHHTGKEDIRIMKKLIIKFISRMVLICPPCPTPIIYIRHKDKVIVV